ESGLNPYAQSPSGAKGPWQYIRSTGKSLGLHRTENYDGIYDFFASTDAGIKYLEKLYADLGDWELVAVAYNQGEYGTRKAIKAAQARGIADPKIDDLKISAYARSYVMRFKAYADVLKNPTKYGVSLPKIANRPAFKRIEVAGKITSLKEAALLSGAHIDTIKKLNSGYTGDKIDSAHGLNMPIEHADTLEKAISSKDSVASNSKLQTSPLVLVK
ncbi:MAG: lytic transglycosylase domain-containing protein, partial [Succinivibrio sp.]|nr:lytic transglycosylase domain-containing protein [Succinivibrio sp.]